MGITRTTPAALAGLLTLGLVAACTSDAPDGDGARPTTDGSRTTVTLTEVEGTRALRPTSTVVGQWDAVVAGTRATVVAELAGSDGTPTRLYAVDPSTRERTSLDIAAPLDWGEAANATGAVVAGDRTQGEGSAPFVRVSTDLKSWQEVPIRYPEQGWSFSDVGLDGDTPVVIAEKPDGSTVLMRLDGQEQTVHDIPAADGQELEPIDLVKHAGTLVLLVDEGVRGDETVTRVLTSDDGGTTWTRGRRLPGAKGSYGVAGVVSTGQNLVATGWANQATPLGTSGMVWTSTNARSWTTERTKTISWYEGEDLSSDDFTLSAPTVVDGKAAFDQTCTLCTWTTRFVQDDAGTLEVEDNQTGIHESGPTSVVLPGTAAGVRLEGGSLVRFGAAGPEVLVDGEIYRFLSSIHVLGHSTHAAVSGLRFTGDPSGGWQTNYRTTPFVIDATLQRKEWTPEVLSAWSRVETATDGEGTTVAAGTLTVDHHFTADTRTLTDGAWREPTGLGRYEYELVDLVAHSGSEFLMGLQVATTGSTAATRRARVYSSSDGVTWEEDDGTWAPTPESSSQIVDICELSDGTALAVGSSQSDANAPSEATVWTRTGGTWSMLVPELEGKGPDFEACATSRGTTVVSGTLGGDDIEWTTTDGETFAAREPLPHGVSRAAPHEVEGGLVAGGYLDTTDHVGPVIWFSTGGQDWQWAPVEVDDNSATVSVMTAGDDRYAVTHQLSGDRLWTIEEIATTKLTSDAA